MFANCYCYFQQEKAQLEGNKRPTQTKSLVRSFSLCSNPSLLLLCLTVVSCLVTLLSLSLSFHAFFFFFILLFPFATVNIYEKILTYICLLQLQDLKYIISDRFKIWTSLSTSSFGHQGINFSPSRSVWVTFSAKLLFFFPFFYGYLFFSSDSQMGICLRLLLLLISLNELEYKVFVFILCKLQFNLGIIVNHPGLLFAKKGRARATYKYIQCFHFLCISIRILKLSFVLVGVCCYIVLTWFIIICLVQNLRSIFLATLKVLLSVMQLLFLFLFWKCYL